MNLVQRIVPARGSDAGLALRRLVVLHVHDLTPGMRRIVLGGEALAGLVVPGRALGPYLKLLIPPDDDDGSGWPTAGADGRLVWPATGRRPAMRTYSIRRFDAAARQLTIDMVLHGPGLAADWARRAEPGMAITTWGPGIALPADADFFALAADRTGVPALAFILENLPATMRGQAFVEVSDPAERIALAAPPGVAVTWLHRLESGPSWLAARLREVVWPVEAQALVWAGAEARIARAIRADACARLPRERVHVLNYWKRGAREGAFDYCI